VVRLAFAGLAYLITLGVAYGLLIPAVPADPTASESFLSPAMAPFVMTAAHGGDGLADPALAAAGLGLAAVMTAVFFGVNTLMPQVESWLFQVSSGMASHLPAEMIPRIARGAAARMPVDPAGRLDPRTVEERRHSRGTRANRQPSADGLEAAAGRRRLRLRVFPLRYYIAWRNPAVRAYYGGTDPGTFWAQFAGSCATVSGFPWPRWSAAPLWTVIGVTVLRCMRGGSSNEPSLSARSSRS
jgi:hypothetical protein